MLPLAETEVDIAELVDEGFMTQADVAGKRGSAPACHDVHLHENVLLASGNASHTSRETAGCRSACLADGGCHVVEVWREELLEATLEIDGALKVGLLCTGTPCSAVCRGCSAAQLRWKGGCDTWWPSSGSSEAHAPMHVQSG